MSSMPQVVLVLMCLVVATHGHPRGFSENCLKCICQTDACYHYRGRCPHTWRNCSAFRINRNYWYIGDKPFGKSYYKCMKSKTCKETTVDNYLSYYNSGGDFVSCYHYARIHTAGPWGWRYRKAIPYRNKVEACCNSIPGGCYTYE